MSETSRWTILEPTRPVLGYEYKVDQHSTSNCVVTPIGDGQLLVLSPATGMSNEAFDQLAQYGEVSAVVATNGWHHLGLATWRERYPAARFFASPEAAARIRKKNPQGDELEPLQNLQVQLGDDVVLRETEFSKCGETLTVIKTESGYVWYASDTLINLPALPGVFVPRLLFKWTRSAPGYSVFNLWLAFNANNKKALLAERLDDLRNHPPSMVIPAHGKPVTDGDVAAKTRDVIQAAL